MKIEVFTAFSPELEEIWREFETEAVGTPFQSYAWLSHWQNTVGSPLHSIQPQLVIVRDEIETLAVLPLGIRNVLGVSILEWLGGLHSDYMGPLLNEEWEKMEKDFPLCWLNIINKLDPFDVIHFQKQKIMLYVLDVDFFYVVETAKPQPFIMSERLFQTEFFPKK